MKLVRYKTPGEPPIEVCNVPRHCLGSMRMIRGLLLEQSERLWLGREGTAFRIANTDNRNALIPLVSRQIVMAGQGRMEYGEVLAFE